ncbi:DUF1592 domain-containing protein [Stieleria varia]|uniref:Planctomycete cytochrome C n=1 Tax=Stieleria varia TaxID=2528005 RepID=A0A5C6B9N9_9BACT|nr:DUF1592 domain-containing protein [Stieleria varia]TWU08151.1 Planctomycete cytochrome C [Stieleria varia]
MRLLLLACIALTIGLSQVRAEDLSAIDGLIALYEFDEELGDSESSIRDTSGVGRAMDLRIGQPKHVQRDRGSIRISGAASILSDGPARKLIDAVKRSGKLTIETWLTTSDINQKGPARIVSLSSDTSNRNVTLGQEGDRYDVRLRSTKTSTNGLPSLSTPAKNAKPAITHVVFTRAASGATQLFVDGTRVSQGKAQGDLSNWSYEYRLALGDEVSGGRPWRGTLYRVALYRRALSGTEITRLHAAGHEGKLADPISPEQLALQRSQQHFDTKVAPLLAAHCLECHDSANAKGDVDLARRESALAKIVPGKPSESELWASVKSDEMPHNRAPLTDEQKQSLRQWIDNGAVWTVDWIDPAIYVNETGKSENFVRRLTVDEYIRSVQAAVGVDISDAARTTLPPDLRADGFRNTAYNLTVDLGHVEAYAELAKQIVSQMDVAAFAKRFGVKPRLTDDDMRGLISKMAPQVLRAELTDHEIVLYRGISTTVAASGGNYNDAVAATLRAMLMSPRFLYRIENQIGDGSRQRLDAKALSIRLSYILWGAPPDDELRRAAESGELYDTAGLKSQVQRMMADPRAEQRSQDFITQWLNMDHLRSLRPSPNHFPDWKAELADDMRRETLAFFDHVVWKEKRPLTDLLNAQVTFLTPRLAKHYGLEPKSDPFAEYDLGEIPARGGLLTQGSVLTIGGDDASMVTRGLLVLNQLLRGVVNDPPPCVDTTPVPTAAGLTQRVIAEQRIANESCGGCHKRFEPLAFGLEKFDGLGSFHQRDEHGNPLREDGQILFPGSAHSVDYPDSAKLMAMLAESDRVAETLVWKLTQFAVGRPLVAADAQTVRQIHRDSQKSGGRYQDILTEIVLSDLVTHIQTTAE